MKINFRLVPNGHQARPIAILKLWLVQTCTEGYILIRRDVFLMDENVAFCLQDAPLISSFVFMSWKYLVSSYTFRICTCVSAQLCNYLYILMGWFCASWVPVLSSASPT